MSHFPAGGAISADSFSLLVVEDDASMARLLEILLSRNGYDVRLARSVAEARTALLAAPADLVILDRMLPDGDGLELARELKQEGSALSRYVLMLTAVSSAAAKVEGFDGGADDYVTKPFSSDELLARVRAGLRIVDLQKALVRANQRLEVISTTDAITGLYNRRWFDETIDTAFAHAMRYERPMSLAVVDIDHFKSVNDTYGHLAGDSVLHEVAKRLSNVLRKSDSIARVGGEEFAVILPETALFEGLQFAEKIRSAISATGVDTGSEAIPLTISVGVASIPYSRLTTATQLLRFADQALYRAKNRGRNRVEMERRAHPWRASAPKEERRAPMPASDIRLSSHA